MANPSVRLSVCLSNAGIMSNRMDIPSHVLTFWYGHHSSFSEPYRQPPPLLATVSTKTVVIRLFSLECREITELFVGGDSWWPTAGCGDTGGHQPRTSCYRQKGSQHRLWCRQLRGSDRDAAHGDNDQARYHQLAVDGKRFCWWRWCHRGLRKTVNFLQGRLGLSAG